ncbi:hypothetical protein MMC10_008216 [Thelotrema lepadinum]|nr:hypothetical protein [Thelotrema lepadinum]
MSVKVVARVRPLLKAELDKDTIVSADGPVVRIPNPKNESENYSFQFNSVHTSEATQQELFDKEVAPTVKHLFNGFDVTIFAYGVTGTGKTHTMRGGKSLADRGVIPRFLSGIYRRCRKIEKDSKGETKASVAMSYYEIYNDKVFDLFEAPEKRTLTGLLLRDNGGKTIVVGLTERPCGTLKDFEKLYDEANVNRSTSATKLNAHSSRSHAVLCVKVSVTTGDQIRISTASAIDLAGSEDNRRTDNNRERLVESSSINKSLFVLAQCVEAISKKQSRIPYRESKMTRILSLGQNNGLTIMILNLAPVRSYHLDTLSSLNFANRTKKIEVREVENEPIFKGCSRQVSAFTGTSLQRQPLRPLTSANHNANVRPPAEHTNDEKVLSKPAKAFSVYSDRSRSSLMNQYNSAAKRSSPLKRPANNLLNSSRPLKVARPTQPALSKSTIEDMVEKKVSEMLAARTIDQTVAPAADISDDVKKRLETLEQRIEGREDSRAEGLSFLLMAKQHQARGEDSSALKMYELAQEYFPSNSKLEGKITKLRQKIQEKKQPGQRELSSTEVSAASLPTHHVDSMQSTRKTKGSPLANDADGSFRDLPHDDPGSGSDPAYSSPHRRSKPKSRKPRSKTLSSTLSLTTSENGSQTPRTQRLLRIINSRDTAQIRLLKGVGAKKAEGIVEALHVADAGSEEVLVESLAQLGRLKGVGVKTVENARMGLALGSDEGSFEF